ncbi:MAG: serine/threonine-protein kinase [Polyangiaceae bacterium]
MAEPEGERWRPPAAFAEYTLIHPLGRGGMGHVYLARDTLLERQVAIKFMHRHRDAVARERFVVEARAAARLQHPNVAAVHRISEVEGRPFIVSEYVPGESLAALATPIPWREALEIGRDLSRGLAAAHAGGVLHRDIKPANAIRTITGGVKLLDFGLAKLGGEGLAPPASARDTTGDAPMSWDTPPTAHGEPAPQASSDGIHSVLASPPEANEAPPAGRMSRSELEMAQTFEATLDPSDPGSPEPPASSVAGALERAPSAAPALTRRGAVMGTPGFMPPEAWLGEPATASTDLYSLGAVLFYLCTGAPPYEGAPARGPTGAVQHDAPRVSERAPGIDPMFAALIDRCLSSEPSARPASAAALLDALESIDGRDVAVPEGNPYRGLLPFEGEHHGLFFGRRPDVRAVIERLRASPFVMVTGQSGVGKSSVCRAGVLPSLARDGLRDGRTWGALTIVPGRAPMTALFTAIAGSVGGPEREEITADMPPRALASALVRALGAGRGRVLFVDQLEELLTLSEPSQVEPFCAVIGELVHMAAPGVRVLATARGDYFTRLAELPALGAAVERAFHLLHPMGRDAIREAIVGPARAALVSFESEALVEELADAGVEGGLPLLQFALAHLWEDRDGDRLTRSSLERLGGVEGALARHADEVIAGMTAPVRAQARRVLSRLVTLERTRSRRTEGELVTGPTARAALDALVRGRLVVARDEGSGEPAYFIAHEALITSWGALRGWLDAAGEARGIRERVGAAAAEWEKLGRSPDALWRGQRLVLARRLDGSELSPLEVAFLGEGERAERRSRWLRGGGVVAILGLLAGVFFGVTALQRREIERRASADLAAGVAAQERGAGPRTDHHGAAAAGVRGVRSGGVRAGGGAVERGPRGEREAERGLRGGGRRAGAGAGAGSGAPFEPRADGGCPARARLCGGAGSRPGSGGGPAQAIGSLR